MDESSSDDLDQPAVIRRTPGPRTATKPAPERAAEPEPEPHTGDLRVGMAEPTVPTNIYRARRPAVALFLVIPAVAVGLLLVRALAISAFGQPFSIERCDRQLAAPWRPLPLLVAGLYGLITGAAHGAEHFGFKVWARPPLAYLVVGISLRPGVPAIAIRCDGLA